MAPHILITGPSRSGKSEWAEHLALEQNQPVIYIATGQENPADPEWQARIDRHRRRRPDHWQTHCADLDLPLVLASLSSPVCGLVDSLGGWVAWGLDLSDTAWQTHQQRFLQTLAACPFPVILVAEETGWGVIPPYPLGRTFRDRLGSLIRWVGAQCHSVYLVTGGYALDLSQWGHKLPGQGSQL